MSAPAAPPPGAAKARLHYPYAPRRRVAPSLWPSLDAPDGRVFEERTWSSVGCALWQAICVHVIFKASHSRDIPPPGLGARRGRERSTHICNSKRQTGIRRRTRLARLHAATCNASGGGETRDAVYSSVLTDYKKSSRTCYHINYAPQGATIQPTVSCAVGARSSAAVRTIVVLGGACACPVCWLTRSGIK